MYCCSYLTNNSLSILENFLRQLNLSKKSSYDFHVTIMFSKSLPRSIKRNTSNITIRCFHFQILKDNLVLSCYSPLLINRHNKWVDLGCEYTFDEYQPHITIIENCYKELTQKQIDDLLQLQFSLDLQIGPEIISNLKS